MLATMSRAQTLGFGGVACCLSRTPSYIKGLFQSDTAVKNNGHTVSKEGEPICAGLGPARR
jgi:hypothetical protein